MRLARYSKSVRSYFSTLIIPDPNKTGSEISSLLKASTYFKEPVDILHLGKSSKRLSDFYEHDCKHDSIKNIHVSEHESFSEHQYEMSSIFIQNFVSKHKYKTVLMGNSAISKELLPRLAPLFQSQPATDVTTIETSNTFKRPIYAGNAVATFEFTSDVRFIGIRLTSFPAENYKEGQSNTSKLVTIKTGDYLDLNLKPKLEILDNKIQKSERPELSKAKVVISGGRGLKSGENFELLNKLSENFKNCAIGASRAAVDAGFVSNDLQVGQTGKIVAPDLYIAVGISGAIQHLAGIKDSKVIVAINNNSDAPIFQVANYGIVGDLFKVVPELTEKLAKLK